MSASTLELTLPYTDVTEFVARFRMVTMEGIELPSPFARKVGDEVRFAVRLLDRTLVMEGTGIVADVTDNGRGPNPDARYDLAIAFTWMTATTQVMIERLILAQEFDTTEPTGMRKAPIAPPPPARTVPAPVAPRHAPIASTPKPRPSPAVRERAPEGDLLEEIDEEDMLTPPPRPLPRAPELAPQARARPETPRPSSPPPLPPRGGRPGVGPLPSALRPSSPPPRPSSPPERPSGPPVSRPPITMTGGLPASRPPVTLTGGAPVSRPPITLTGGERSSGPSRSSMTPLPPAPAASPPARTAAPRRRTAPGTGSGTTPADLRVKTDIDRLPSFDTQTDLRRGPPVAHTPAGTTGPARMPVPTRAAPAARTLRGGPVPEPAAPPRRKTGQRKALETPAEPPAPVRAPPRKKTLPGAAGDERAAPRRKTGTTRAVVEPAAPPRRRTGQRRAIDPNDITQQTPTIGHEEEDTDRGAPVPPGRK